VSSRIAALGAALACGTLVLAQDVVPAWAGFHTWPYATVLAILALAIGRYALGARAGSDGPTGRRLVPAMLGALVVAAAGLSSGLLGPDTETVQRAPGTVAPLPDVGAAAFFAAADAAAIGRGDAGIVLRRRNAAAVELSPGERSFLGATVLELAAQPAAYIEARDGRGNHLTITQPTNAAFLSPVLLFPERIVISGETLPADSFAAPALGRQIKAFYFSKAASAPHPQLHPGESVLFAVNDDSGHLLAGAIGFAQSGQEITLGGVRLRPSIGTYPALVISAVPYPLALWVGGLLFLAGLAYAFGRPFQTQKVANRTATSA